MIAFSAPNWSKWGESPLWLGIMGEDGKPSAKVRDALARASIDFKEDRESDFCYVPIRLTTGVEQEKVIQHAMAQIIRVADNLPPANVTVKSDPTKANLTQASSGDSMTEILDDATDAAPSL